MTTFFVGQRVRIKYAMAVGASCVGKEATVLSRLDLNGVLDIAVDGVPPPWGVCWTAIPDQLEPLTDSYTLVSWESMRELWMPEHLREVA